MKKNPNERVCSEDPVTGECATPRRVSRALLVVSAISLLVFWPLAAVVLFRGNALGFAIALFVSGLSQGPFLAGYAFARADRKQWWRWLVLATGGLGILMFSLVDAVNLDLDGFFELLILGTLGPAIGHTMVTTVVGPLIFGRVLCGWGCWRAMVLERLPVGKGSGRRKGVWVWTPLVGVAVSFAAAALFALVLDSQSGGARGHMRGNSVWSVAAGVAVYYAAAIALASGSARPTRVLQVPLSHRIHSALDEPPGASPCLRPGRGVHRMRGVHESLSDGHSRGCACENGHTHWQRRLHPLSALRCELSDRSAENEFQKRRWLRHAITMKRTTIIILLIFILGFSMAQERDTSTLHYSVPKNRTITYTRIIEHDTLKHLFQVKDYFDN